MRLSAMGQCRSDATRQGIHLRVSAPGREPRPGLILDRDGVLVDFVNYLHRASETRLADGAAELVRVIRQAGVAVGVATNQAGVDRMLYAWDDYFAVEKEIDRQLAIRNAALDGVAACPYHPNFTSGWSERHAYWRKPGPGMIELLIREMNVDRRRCWMIGDHLSDIGAAKAAGLPGALLIARERDKADVAEAAMLASPSFKVNVIGSLLDALPLLVDLLALPGDIGRGLQTRC